MAGAMKKLLLTQPIDECGHALAAQRNDVEVEVCEGLGPAEIRHRIADADGIVVRGEVIDRAVIDAGRRLAIISRHGVGFETVDIEAAARRSIPVTITPRANAVSVAEHAVFLLLALAKDARANDSATREGRFTVARRSMKPLELARRNLLIVGFGRTGSRVAPLALAFGMQVHVSDPYVDRSLIEAAGCTVVDDLHAALPRMDAVTVHTPLTDETRGLFGGDGAGAPESRRVRRQYRAGRRRGRGCADCRARGQSARWRRPGRIRVRAGSATPGPSAPRL